MSKGSGLAPGGACRNGHFLEEADIYVAPSGLRFCRLCKRAALKRYKSTEKYRVANGRYKESDKGSEVRRGAQRRWKTKNPEKIAEWGRRWKAENPEKLREQKRRAKKSGASRLAGKGINRVVREEALAAQGQSCATCASTVPGGIGDWHIDHDHNCCPGTQACGKCFRALLCHYCNTGSGQLNDDPERLRAIADMIERFQLFKVMAGAAYHLGVTVSRLKRRTDPWVRPDRRGNTDAQAG